MGHIKDWTLNSKINFTIIVLFTFLMVIFLAVILYVSSLFDKRMNEVTDSNMRTFMRDFDSTMGTIGGNGDYFLGDNTIQHNLTIIRDSNDLSQRLSAKRHIEDQLDSVLDTMPYIRNITFVLSPYETVNSGSGFTLRPDEVARINSQVDGINGRPLYVGADGYLYYVREIRRKENLALDHLAYLYMRIDINQLMRSINQKYDLAGTYFTVSYDGDTVYDDVPEDLDEDLYHIDSKALDGAFSYTAYVPEDSIGDDLLPVLTIAISALMASSLLSLAAGRKLMKSFAQHLDILGRKMTAFESGSFNPSDFPSYENRNDEIGLVQRNFDLMAWRFQRLIEEDYIKELAIKDSQLKVLTSQTNPHFLYNVLNSIYLKAEEKEAHEAASMAWSLAGLLRMASANKNTLVPLRDELEYLGYYIDIQKMRFSDRLDYVEHIDQALLGKEVPRFSIQPLVENAIKHAMEESDEVCTITVEALRLGSMMRICVSNTGSSFPDDLEDRIANDHHVGLHNINQRLALLFKTRLTFENRDGLALVSFTIPLEDDDVQSTPC